ncbi:unnamed protein product [Brassica rapa subsp. narinosa]
MYLYIKLPHLKSVSSLSEKTFCHENKTSFSKSTICCHSETSQSHYFYCYYLRKVLFGFLFTCYFHCNKPLVSCVFIQ